MTLLNNNVSATSRSTLQVCERYVGETDYIPLMEGERGRGELRGLLWEEAGEGVG